MLQQHHVMFLSRAFGHGLSLRAIGASSTPRRPHSIGALLQRPLRPLPRAPSPPSWARVLSRAATGAARNDAPVRQVKQRASEQTYRYPEDLNVYRHGAFTTVWVGMLRLLTIFGLLAGTFWLFPSYTWAYFRPGDVDESRKGRAKWWTGPAVLVCSWVPALFALFALSPWAHQIHVRLPAVARQTQKELMRWATHVPRDTLVTITVMRFKPWPEATYARFGDLYQLPPSSTRLTNLEIFPPGHAHYLAQNSDSAWARLKEKAARNVFGRYFVNRTQTVDRSAAPGVWDKMWQQIPMEWERAERLKTMEQSVLSRARAVPPTERIAPPPRRKS